MHDNFTRMRTHDVRRFHALCEIHLLLREVCARSLHADFKRCWRFNGFLEDVRTQFAQRYADARAKPMPAPGVRSMKLEACSACTRGPEPEVRSLQPEERNKKPEPEAQSLQHAFGNSMNFPESSLLVNPNAAPIKSEHRASRIRTPRDSNPNTAPSRILWISRMSRASRHSLTFTGSSPKHLSVTGTCLMRAFCEIHMLLRDMCARTLHETFMRMRTQYACRFHALCEIQLLLHDLRTQFA